MNNLILIDDRQDFIDAFTTDCAARQYALYSKRSLAGLKDLMPAMHHKISCIILDIKCLHDDNQEIEDASFIGSALTYLDQNFPKFPRLILTGDDKEYEQIKKYYKDEDIYLKTPDDKDRLFTKIKYYVDSSDELRVKRSNPEPFEAFSPRIIPEDKGITFYRLIKIAEEGIFEKKDFNTIRELLEDILVWANLRGLIPDSCMNPDGRPNLGWSYRYLSGLPIDVGYGKIPIKTTKSVLPQHISRTMDMVKQNSSILSHTYKEKFTLNAYKATLFGLAEILCGAKTMKKLTLKCR